MAEPTPPSAQPPHERVAPHLGTPSAAAAGLFAVAKTAQLTAGMGLIRGARALLQINQADGFDCQSCAWPSPDHDRHVFEFCESGAKAVADEANVLVPLDSVAAGSNTPTSKFVLVTIEPAKAEAYEKRHLRREISGLG